MMHDTVLHIPVEPECRSSRPFRLIEKVMDIQFLRIGQAAIQELWGKITATTTMIRAARIPFSSPTGDTRMVIELSILRTCLILGSMPAPEIALNLKIARRTGAVLSTETYEGARLR